MLRPWQVTVSGLALGAALAVALAGVGVLLVFGGRLTRLVELVAGRLPPRFRQLALDTWSHVLVALEPLRDLLVVTKIGR